MDFHFSLTLGRGFVRLENTVFYVGDRVAFRADGDRLVGVPWAGSPERPERWVAGEALWATEVQSHLTAYRGPWLTPLKASGSSLAGAFEKPGSLESLCWLGAEPRYRETATIYRFDFGRGEPVRRLPLEDSSLPLDAWALETGVLLLRRNGLHLLAPKQDTAQLLRHSFARDARFLGFDAEGLWIRSGDKALCYREGELVEEGHPLEFAGDAWAWRDGDGLKLRGDSPLRSHKALRDARHAFLDGKVLWVANGEGIARVDSKGLKRFPNPGPLHAQVVAMAPTSAGIAAIAQKGVHKEVSVFDGGWRSGPSVDIEVLESASHDGKLWLATTKGL